MTTRESAVPPERTISHELPFVDAVRAGSSILVVISHVGLSIWPKFVAPFNSIGALAVDFFMIVSGFLMVLSMTDQGEPRRLGPGTLGSFYIRRFFRISPAFYLALFLSLLLTPSSLPHVLLRLTYLNGLFPASSAEPVIPPFWSISLEVQFYAVIPFLLAAFRYVRPGILLAGCCLVNLVASQLWGIYGRPGLLGSFAHVNFLPLALGLFVMGIVLGLHLIRSRHAPPFWASAALILCTPFLHSQFKHAYVAAAGTLVVLLWIAPPVRGRKLIEVAKRHLNFLTRGNRITKALADYSYSLYLFHLFVVIGVSNRMRSLSEIMELPPLVLFFVMLGVVLAFSYAISFMTFTLIERPGVRLGKLLQRAWTRRFSSNPHHPV